MPSESSIVRSITRTIVVAGGISHNVTVGLYERKGTADILACFRGRFIYIEVKTDEGEVEPRQRYEMKRWAAAGAITIVARSSRTVKDILSAIEINIAREAAGMAPFKLPQDDR